MKTIPKWAAVAALAILVCSCASAPSYPQPHGSNGQILVNLKGEPKDGVRGPKRQDVREEYSITRESVEKGKAFERVDYDELQDVVVIVDSGSRVLVDVPQPSPAASEIELDDGGFNRSQVLAVASGKGPAVVTLHNQRSTTLHLYGFSDSEVSFDAEVGSSSLGTIRLSVPGRYDVYCEEDESLHMVIFVSNHPAWIGDSDDGAFFDSLPPGDYEVTVYPPRLPEWSKKVSVTAGKRTTLTAELTVNNLPKVGK